MNTITHVSVGAAIGYSTNNPILAFVGGFTSHIILDVIPHTDQGTFLRINSERKWPMWVWITVYLDVFLAGGLFLLIISQFPSIFWQNIFWGSLGAIIIDIADNVPYWNKKLQQTKIGKIFHLLHEKWHTTVSLKFYFYGILIQLIVLGGALWFLWQKSLLF